MLALCVSVYLVYYGFINVVDLRYWLTCRKFYGSEKADTNWIFLLLSVASKSFCSPSHDLDACKVWYRQQIAIGFLVISYGWGEGTKSVPYEPFQRFSLEKPRGCLEILYTVNKMLIIFLNV